MRKLKLVSLLLLLLIGVGQVWATDVTFTAGTDTSDGLSLTKDGVTITLSSGTLGRTDNYRCYANATMTISSTSTITAIEFNCNANGTSKGGPGTISTTTGTYSASTGKTGSWSGSATSIEFSASQQCQINSFVVTIAGGEQQPTLSSIAVATAPTTLTYTEGEYFDPTGLVITRTYSSGDPDSYTYANHTSEFSFTPSTSTALTTSDASVTITYGGKSTSQAITVNAAEGGQGGGSETPADQSFDLSKKTYTTGTNLVTWSNSYVTITNSGTNATNYLGGDGNNRTSSRFYNNNTLTITPANGYTISTIEFTATSESYASTLQGSTWNNASASVSGTKVTVTPTTGSSSVSATVGGTCGFTSIVVKFASSGSGSQQTTVCAAPTFSPAAGTYTSTQNVTLSCETENSTIYYTTGEGNPTNESTQYSGAISVSETSTIKAIAYVGNDASSVATATYTIYPVAHAGTQADPYTVADARNAIDANTGLNNVYATGIVSEIVTEYSSQYHNISYNISTDGLTTSDQLQAFRGKSFNGDNFTSADDIKVGDAVVVYGTLKKHNSIYEFDQDNQLYLFNRLAWSETSYDAEIGGTNVYPTLTNTNVLTVTYSSSNSEYATINPSTGEINPLAEGTTVITAATTANGVYCSQKASYTLNVKPEVVRYTITYHEKGGSDVDDASNQTTMPETFPTTTLAGKNFGGWWFMDGETYTTEAEANSALENDVDLYAKWLEPYTVNEALEIIDAYSDNGTSATNLYVKGIVCTEPAELLEGGYLTYYISTDGTETSRLQVYKGKNEENEAFTSVDDVQLGDVVVVYGTLKKYVTGSGDNKKTTPEINTPNYIYSLTRKQDADLAWKINDVVVTSALVGKNQVTKVYPTLANEHSLSVSFTSSVEAVATIANDGTITLGNENGTTTITATFNGNNTYRSAVVSYELTVRETLVYATITYQCNGATGGCPETTTLTNQTDLPTTLPTLTKTDSRFGGWFTNEACTEAAEAGSALTGNVTLYAKWNEIPTFVASDHEWQLVTTAEQLVVGKYYLIAESTNQSVASQSLSSGYLSTIAATMSDGVIAYNGFTSTNQVADAANVAVFELGGESGAWTLTEVLAENTGLLGYNAANLTWGITDANTTVWPISIAANNDATIGSTATADDFRILYNYNNGNTPRFKTYKGQQNMSLPIMYVWSERVNKLIYNANGGSNAPETQKAVNGQATVTIEVPTAPENKIFKEWNTQADGTGTAKSANDVIDLSSADVTLYAQWRDPVSYTVSYNANEGTLKEGETAIIDASVQEGATVTVAANVYEKDGYEFDGWLYGGQTYDGGDELPMPQENVEFVAQWAQVTSTNVTFIVGENPVGSATNLPQLVEWTIEGVTIPEVEGFTFLGWSETEISTETTTAPTTLYTETYTPRAGVTAVTLYGVYSREDNTAANKHYVLDYNTDVSYKTLGYGNAVDVTASDGSEWIVTAAKQTGMQINTGKTAWIKVPVCSAAIEQIEITCNSGAKKAVAFVAALEDENAIATGTESEKQILDLREQSVTTGYIIPSGGNCQISHIDVEYSGIETYYTSWPVEKVLISYDMNGGEGSCSNITVDKGSTNVTLCNDEPTKEGYVFAGWSDGNQVYNAGATIESIQGDLSLQATWNKAWYNVTIDTENGTVSAATLVNGKAEYESEVTITCTPSEGYAFKSVQVYKTDDQETVVSVVDNKFTMPAYAVTVAATFESEEVIEYTISYDANGGVGTMVAGTVTGKGSSYTVKANTFTKTLATFAGWNTQADGTGLDVAVGATINVTSDITLYAQWEVTSAAVYTVTSTSAVTESGAIPAGSSATYSSTYTSKCQLTNGNKMTLTLSGYAGKKITDIVLSMKSNSSAGAGYLSVKAGTTTLATIGSSNSGVNFNNASWYGSWSGSYVPVTVNLMNSSYPINKDEDVVIVIGATTNSLYCESFTIAYEDVPAIEVSGDQSISELTGLQESSDIVVPEGATLTMDQDVEVTSMTVENGAVMDLSTHTITTDVLIFQADNTGSSQLMNVDDNSVVSENIYFEKNFVAEAYHWYNVAVPFPVNIAGGVQKADGTPLTIDQDFDFYYYDGAVRASQGKVKQAWVKEDEQLQPGVNYICVFDQAFGIIRFQMDRSEGNHINNAGEINNLVYGSGTDDGWNGIANNGLTYVSATLEGVRFVQILNEDGDAYVTIDLSSATFMVGTPFFVQAGQNASVVFGAAGSGDLYAPQRVADESIRIPVELIKNGKMVDRLYVTASEDATLNYEVGKDLVKFSTSATAAQLWVNNYNEKLCANDAPLVNDQAIYDLGIYAPTAGTYSLSAAAIEGADLYVTYGGQIVWNLSLGDYEMDLVRGTTTGYGLLLVAQPNQMPTGVENGELLNGENGVQKILLNGQLYILRDGHLYDAVGKEMK